ncbi:MAG TPA: regulatory protein RecX [Thermoanaerobaculia bacterium]|jgi:regulatory protein|nr:regulatory protein RecX [Thermoanaerobaculia bacterium]
MPPTVYDKAVQLLAARPHFRRELEGKLARRGYPPEEIAATLDRLGRQGYLNEAETARAFVAVRQARGAEGRSRLKAELVKRGAAGDAIEAALADLTPEDDLAAAREAAAKWARGGKSDPQALARHLQRKGFSPRAIVAALKERPEGDGVADLWDLNEDDSA